MASHGTAYGYRQAECECECEGEGLYIYIYTTGRARVLVDETEYTLTLPLTLSSYPSVLHQRQPDGSRCAQISRQGQSEELLPMHALYPPSLSHVHKYLIGDGVAYGHIYGTACL